MNHRDILINTIQESLGKLEEALRLIEEDKLESSNEQSAGKPQRSAAQILAEEAARTGAQKVGDRGAAQILSDALNKLRNNVDNHEFRLLKEDAPTKAEFDKLTFDINEVNKVAIGDRKDAQFHIHDPWEDIGQLSEWLDIKSIKESANSKAVSLSEIEKIFDWVNFKQHIGLYKNYTLRFYLGVDLYITIARTNIEPYASTLLPESKTRVYPTDWTCANKRSDVEKLSFEIKDWIDTQIDCQNHKPKSQKDAIALSKAFDWVIWSIVQPSGLSGDYRNRSLDIRHEGDYYMVYYAGNSYSFPKNCDLTIASQVIKSRIDFEFPRNNYAI